MTTVDPGNIDSAIHQLASNQWLCLCCHKISSSKSNARIHTRVIHLKEKKFVCEFCGKKSGYISDHKRHLRVCKSKPN